MGDGAQRLANLYNSVPERQDEDAKYVPDRFHPVAMLANSAWPVPLESSGVHASPVLQRNTVGVPEKCNGRVEHPGRN